MSVIQAVAGTLCIISGGTLLHFNRLTRGVINDAKVTNQTLDPRSTKLSEWLAEAGVVLAATGLAIFSMPELPKQSMPPAHVEKSNL